MAVELGRVAAGARVVVPSRKLKPAVPKKKAARAIYRREVAAGRAAPIRAPTPKPVVAPKAKERIVTARPAAGPLRRGYITEVIKRPVSGRGPVFREITAMPDPREDLRGKIVITETVRQRVGPFERVTIGYREKERKVSKFLKEKAPVIFGREGALGARPIEREVIRMR